MKIAHVIGYFQPELGYQEYYLAKTQAALGNEVHVVTSDRIWPFENVEEILTRIDSPYRTRMRPIGDSFTDGIHIHRLPALVEFSDFVLVKGLAGIIRSIKPDVVHAHEARQGTSVLPGLYKSLGYIYVVDHHGYKMPEGYKARLEYMFFRKLITEYAFRKADAILPINDYIERLLLSTHRVERHKIRKINTGIIAEGNGADTDTFFFDGQSRAETRKHFNIEDPEILLVFAGKMDKRKSRGLEVLIRAFAELSKHNPVKLLLIGSGDTSCVGKLIQLTHELSCDGSVIFHDFVVARELHKFYSAADIAIFPSASITILEAMACGLPIILPQGGREDRLVSFRNGSLFLSDDKDDLVKKLLPLVASGRLREEMGRNSSDAVHKFFSYKVIADHTIALYEELLDSRKIKNS